MGKIITVPEGRILVPDDSPNNIKLLGFDSDYPSFQIVRIYKSEMTLKAETGIIISDERVIPHGLKFSPLVFSYIGSDININLGARSIAYVMGNHYTEYAEVFWDATNITCYANLWNIDIDPDTTVTFTFYIFVCSIPLE